MRRRALLLAAGLPWTGARAVDEPAVVPRTLEFPRDFGAHPAFRTEWWYATGWLKAEGSSELCGFQLTFFRSRTGLAEGNPSRFAARQLLFAHAAVSDLADGRLLHSQRIARWSGDEAAPRAAASLADTSVRLGDWRFERSGEPGASRYEGVLADKDAGFGYTLTLTATQPVLLQGDAGLSRKGPEASEASHYYSQPQLAAAGTLSRGGRTQPVSGRAWLDHEWCQSYLAPQAVGWDWIGINLDDGGALMAFRLRRADGTALWAGGSYRPPGGAARSFASNEVRFAPGRVWVSPLTQARYPVEWRIDTPAGRFAVRALMDNQELDSRGSTGAVYWEGLSELSDAASGRRAGLGYLEMTGVVSPLRLG